MVAVSSLAFAAQICRPSGAISKPSAPFPDLTLLTDQVVRPAPAGTSGPPLAAASSMMLIVPERTFDVTMRAPLTTSI